MNEIIRVWSRGNSTGIVIPFRVCQELGIKPGTLLSFNLSRDRKTIMLSVCGYREPWHGPAPHITEQKSESLPTPVTQTLLQRLGLKK